MAAVVISSNEIVRRRWTLAGQIQGVGFRPFVYRTARDLGLIGFVRNNGQGVIIEAQGPSAKLDSLIHTIREKAPTLAKIASITSEERPPGDLERGFHIAGSSDESTVGHRADVTVDVAVCDACLVELFEKGNRRYRYGLINCTDCGPRYSIVKHVPYDRCNTTMAHFEMCPDCRREYEDPEDRRFHAQPTACLSCGPKVSFALPDGKRVEVDPIARATEKLLNGEILAIKGLGGFHLAARADSDAAVGRLRTLKHRDAKPFAVMCASIAQAERLVYLDDRARSIMLSPACPIVLAPRRNDAPVSSQVAPQNHRLGVMLPYTPIQHLLFAQMVADAPPLVMTSANGSDEPLVFRDEDAVSRLGKMCSGILWHDRPIARGVDDSVLIDMGSAEPIFIRRARGYVPQAIVLPVKGDHPGLALGGELKSTVAVTRDHSAILSQHIGDLTHPRAYHVFVETIKDLCELFHVEPQWIAHDLHPNYLSTVHAKKVAGTYQAPLVGIQHHHAHAASVMAEHGTHGPVLAVVCDGTGYGTDGTIWGGELLLADLVAFRRLARIRPLKLAGGDAAARDLRRSALALLEQTLGDGFEKHPAVEELVPDAAERDMLTKMIVSGVSCVQSSGAGRLFDAVAALLGICSENQFEAQAAMALESAAQSADFKPDGRKLFEVHGKGPGEVVFSPLVRDLLEGRRRGTNAGELAALFHEQFCQAWSAVVQRGREDGFGVRCAVRRSVLQRHHHSAARGAPGRTGAPRAPPHNRSTQRRGSGPGTGGHRQRAGGQGPVAKGR